MLTLNRSNFQGHPYHLVAPSLWPLLTALYFGFLKIILSKSFYYIYYIFNFFNESNSYSYNINMSSDNEEPLMDLSSDSEHSIFDRELPFSPYNDSDDNEPENNNSDDNEPENNNSYDNNLENNGPKDNNINNNFENTESENNIFDKELPFSSNNDKEYVGLDANSENTKETQIENTIWVCNESLHSTDAEFSPEYIEDMEYGNRFEAVADNSIEKVAYNIEEIEDRNMFEEFTTENSMDWLAENSIEVVGKNSPESLHSTDAEFSTEYIKDMEYWDTIEGIAAGNSGEGIAIENSINTIDTIDESYIGYVTSVLERHIKGNSLLLNNKELVENLIEQIHEDNKDAIEAIDKDINDAAEALKLAQAKIMDDFDKQVEHRVLHDKNTSSDAIQKDHAHALEVERRQHIFDNINKQINRYRKSHSNNTTKNSLDITVTDEELNAGIVVEKWTSSSTTINPELINSAYDQEIIFPPVIPREVRDRKMLAQEIEFCQKQIDRWIKDHPDSNHIPTIPKNLIAAYESVGGLTIQTDTKLFIKFFNNNNNGNTVESTNIPTQTEIDSNTGINILTQMEIDTFMGANAPTQMEIDSNIGIIHNINLQANTDTQSEGKFQSQVEDYFADKISISDVDITLAFTSDIEDMMSESDIPFDIEELFPEYFHNPTISEAVTTTSEAITTTSDIDTTISESSKIINEQLNQNTTGLEEESSTDPFGWLDNIDIF